MRRPEHNRLIKMTVLLHSALTVSCYNQHFLISILFPGNPKSAWKISIFVGILPSPISESVNQHFTPGRTSRALILHYCNNQWRIQGGNPAMAPHQSCQWSLAPSGAERVVIAL